MRVILDNDWEYIFEEDSVRFCIWNKHDWWHIKRWDDTGGWHTITSIPSNNRDEATNALLKIAKEFV